jgi:hypothetical protein
MKKNYVKPASKKVEIDGDIIRMLTKEGFAALFWESLAQARREEPCTTQEEVFDTLNEKYFAAIGSLRYSSYDSFRQRLNKK